MMQCNNLMKKLKFNGFFSYKKSLFTFVKHT